MPLFETPEPITLDLDLPVGDALLQASKRMDTVVEIRPSRPSTRGDVEAAEATTVEFADGLLTIKVPRTWRSRGMFGAGPSVDVVVQLPSGSRVRADSSWSTFRSEGRLGDASFTSGTDVRLDETGALNVKGSHGNVNVRRATGPAHVTASSGRIRIEHLDAGGELRNSSGDIWVGEAGGALVLKNSSGAIDVEHALGPVNARSAYGGVRLAEVVRGRVDLQNTYGAIEVGVRDGTAAWLDLDSRHGRVHQTLTATDAPGSGDAVELRVSTNYGDITVQRA